MANKKNLIWDKYCHGKYLDQIKLIEEAIKDLNRF